MGLFSAIGAASSIIGVGASLYGSSKAADAADDAARVERKMTMEQTNRLSGQQARDKSKAEVLVNAGGFSAASTTNEIYMREFERLQDEEMDWLQLVGASRYNAKKDQADAIRLGGYANAFAGLAGIAGDIGQAGGFKGWLGIDE